MKLAVLQENMKAGLTIVAPAVSTRSTLPVLGNVLLEADGGGLKLSAMNLEVSISTYVGALVAEPGGVTLPARLLRDLVGALPKERIDMELNARTQTMRLTCGRTDAQIKGIDLAEFPILPSPKVEPTITLPVGDLRRLIKGVIHAAATDISRPVLTGVLLKIENQQIGAAATDGFRLAARCLPVESFANANVLVPGRALAALLQMTNGEEDEEMAQMFVREDNAQVFFRLPGADIAAQTIDANYPDYKRLIPSTSEAHYMLGAVDLARAVRTALIFADNDMVQLTVSEADQAINETSFVLSVAATGKETGDAETVLSLEAGSDAKGMEIAVNGDFVLQALAALDAPEVAIEFTGKGRPLVLRPLDGTDGVQVVMPMVTK